MKPMKGLIAGVCLVALLSGCNIDSVDCARYEAKRYDRTIDYRIENDGFFDTFQGEITKENRIIAGKDSELRRSIVSSINNYMKLHPEKYPIVKYEPNPIK